MLPTILALAAIDSLNPSSISGATYLAGSEQMARLRQFILGVYCTYLTFGLALTFGPAAVLRSALAATPTVFGPIVELGIGGLLIGMGMRTWCERGSPRRESAPAAAPGRSGLALGLLATLADLPTAGPLLAATLLLAAGKHKVWTQFPYISLYNVVYVSPLLAVAIAQSVASRIAGRATGWRQSLLVRAPAVAAIGAIIGCEGVAALV